MSWLTYRFTTHSQRVCTLYKKCLRELDFYHNERCIVRYHAVRLRAKFEESRNIKDEIVANKMLLDGEEEYFASRHHQPVQFARSPGGIEYGREIIPNDDILDQWHPREKAAFPEYFSKRELRKKEFIKFWEENYANVPKMEDIPK